MVRVRKSQKVSILGGKSLLIFVLAAWAFYLSSYQVYLRLDNSNTHVPLFWVAVKANDSFMLHYARPKTHTIYLEHYRIIHGKQFVLTGVSFRSASSQRKQLSENSHFKALSGGWRTLQNLSRKMDVIPFVMGASNKAAQFLIIRDRKFPLTKVASPGTPVVLKVLRTRKFSSLFWRIHKWLNNSK